MTMPEYVFVRDRKAELDGGYALAGNLFTSTLKGAEPTKHDQEVIASLIQCLVSYPPTKPIYRWKDGRRPLSATKPTLAEIDTWAKTHTVIAIRASARTDAYPQLNKAETLPSAADLLRAVIDNLQKLPAPSADYTRFQPRQPTRLDAIREVLLEKWRKILPDNLAKAQTKNEIGRLVARANKHATYHEIGTKLGITGGRAQQLGYRARPVAPIIRYFEASYGADDE